MLEFIQRQETIMSADEFKNGMIMHLDTWDIHCEHCWQAYPITDKAKFADHYFRDNARPQCGDCDSPIDWWASTLKSIKKVETSSIHEICLSIGSRMTVAQIPLVYGRALNVDFKDFEIPDDALILNVNYNTVIRGERPAGAGTLQSVEIYQNPLFRRTNPQGATFYGIPHGDPPYDGQFIHITVTWAPNTANDESSQNLLNAFLYYIDNRNHGAVIAANASVEAKLSRLMAEFLNNAGPAKSKVDGFLKDVATYGHNLNVLLPALLSFTKAPKLPDHIRGALNKVRTLRNNLAHANITYDKISQDDAAEALSAAVFGLHYLNVIEPFLFRKIRKRAEKTARQAKGVVQN
jgi:hypothetical protein